MPEPSATDRAVDDLTDTATGDVLGGRVAATVTEQRVRAVVARVARHAYQQGRSDAILELLTTEQVAAALGVTRSYVIKLAKRHDLGWNIGRDWLFRPEDVAALRRRETRPGPKRISG